MQIIPPSLMPMETATIQGGVAAAVTTALFIFRKYGFKTPAISDEMLRVICLIASSVAAFLTAVGVSFTLEGNFQQGGKIMIAFPALADLSMHAFGQFMFQDYLHQRFAKPIEMKELVKTQQMEAAKLKEF